MKIVKGLPAIVVFNKESSWVSCQTITRNLLKAYEKLWGKEGFNLFFMGDTREEHWPLAQKVWNSNPSRVVFLDHYPHPMEFLMALNQKYEGEELPELIFHVYGDFTLYPKEWLSLQSILKNTQVKFVCASNKQVDLVSKFLIRPKTRVERCHFPSDVTKFHFSRDKRNETRRQLGLRDDEIAIIYSGRISLQKNVEMLMQYVVNLMMRSPFSIRFFVAGPFDDIGAPFFGLHFEKGYAYQRFQSRLKMVPEEFQSRMKYLGNLNTEDLHGLYCAGDVFASLSLYHDEDYGMAPAEALMCGLPVVLSDWGGYASFSGDERDCLLAPVDITGSGLAVSGEEFFKHLFVYSMIDHDNTSLRLARSERAAKRLSVDAASNLLRDMYNKPIPKFDGFSWRLKRFSDAFNNGMPFPEGPKWGTFYEEIYESYTKKTKNAVEQKKSEHSKRGYAQMEI